MSCITRHSILSFEQQLNLWRTAYDRLRAELGRDYPDLRRVLGHVFILDSVVDSLGWTSLASLHEG